jgi:hypothetical protein
VKWWAVIDNVMNLLVFHRRLGIFWQVSNCRFVTNDYSTELVNKITCGNAIRVETNEPVEL